MSVRSTVGILCAAAAAITSAVVVLPTEASAVNCVSGVSTDRHTATYNCVVGDNKYRVRAIFYYPDRSFDTRDGNCVYPGSVSTVRSATGKVTGTPTGVAC